MPGFGLVLPRQFAHSTTAASVALGRLAVAQDGDVLLKGLPQGETSSLRKLLGIDNVTVTSRPRLSPSGEWLAFLLKEPDGWVFVHQVDGSGSYDLEESGLQKLYAWSPVEDRLAYVAGQGELKLTGEYGSERAAPPISNPMNHRHSLGPDGQWIAYSVGELEGTEDASTGIWKVPVDGGEPVELHANTGSDTGAGVYRLLGWTPNNQSLIFWEGNPYLSASLAADGLPLMRIPAEGGEAERLAESVLLYEDFVSPDPSGSGRIAVVSGGSREATEDKALYVIGDSEGIAVSPAGYAATSPAWSPDGRYLAYVAMPEASDLVDEESLMRALMGRKLWLYDRQSGESRQPGPGLQDEYPLWSAGGATCSLCAWMRKSGCPCESRHTPTANCACYWRTSALGEGLDMGISRGTRDGLAAGK
jgi:Tol biopolymer transport system component